jgi:glycosyltransferase EpsJ
MAIIQTAGIQSPLLSIVITCYNASAYIERCLNSVVADNDCSRTEVICVDDGSVDNTPALLRDFASRYPQQISLITKENGGPSSARNAGMDLARGRFLMFIDVDDYINADTLVKIYDICDDASHPDVAIFSYNRVARSGVASQVIFDDKTYTDRDLDLFFRVIYGNFHPWAKVYSVDFLNGARYDNSLRFLEDCHFNTLVFSRCKKISTYSLVLYNYIFNGQNLTSKYYGDYFWYTLSTNRDVLTHTYANLQCSEQSRQELLAQAYHGYAFDILIEIYSIYRAGNRPKRHKYSLMKAILSDIPQIMPIDQWHARLNTGIPSIFSRLTRIHPRLGHLFLSTIFNIERIKKRIYGK